MFLFVFIYLSVIYGIQFKRLFAYVVPCLSDLIMADFVVQGSPAYPQMSGSLRKVSST